MKETNFFFKYKSIVAFLIVEVLALVSFSFANINEVLYLVSSLLSIAAFTFSFATNVNKKDYLKLLPVLALLFIISGIAAFGGLSHSFSILSNIATFLAIPGFFSLGFFSKRIGEVKTEYILFGVGGGLAALVLFSTFATWIEYGPFYSLIYKIKDTTNYYYNGVTYDITKEMSWLVGFSFTEVSQQYGGLFAVMCGVYLPALIFINRKEQKRYFVLSAVIGGIGLLSILTVPNFDALAVLTVSSLFAFIYKFLRTKKFVLRGSLILVSTIIGLGLVVFLTMVVNAAMGFKFGGVLEKVFVTNFFVRDSSSVLEGAFAKTLSGNYFNLFGFDLSNPAAGLHDLNSKLFLNTGIFEFELLKEIGIVGIVFVIIFFIAMFVFVVKYLKTSNDSPLAKNIYIMFVLAVIIYCTFEYTIFPQTHCREGYQAVLRSVPFMLSLFMLGSMYYSPNKVEFLEPKKEENI